MTSKRTTGSNIVRKNIALVGGGYWGKNLIRNFAQLGALRTICDIDPEKLKSYESLYPGVNTSVDYRQVLVDHDIQGVVIAAPAALHYSLAKEALLAGKDVFVEKPLALKIEQGEEIIRLAEQNNRILLVGHLLEYHPAVAKLKEIVDSGELGKINYIYSNRLNLGKFRTEENILWSFAPHDISIILLLMGEMPQTVSARGGYYLHHDIADITLTVLEFGNGIQAHIFISWLHPYKEQKLVVVGDKKMAVFDDNSTDKKLLLYNHEIEWVDGMPVPHPKQPQVIEVPADEPLRIECQDFIKSIADRRKPRVDGRKGLQVLEVLSFCQKSLEGKGKIISMGRGGKSYLVHETSIVEEPCKIGEGTKIWHFCHVMPEVTIGRNCVIGQNGFVGQGVKIGDNVKIENNISVFEAVTLEDDVFCGPSCVFTNVINPRSEVSRKHEYKPTLVKKGASIGANVTIVCGNTIGRYAFVGAGAVVTRDVPDYALVYGNPARLKGWVCECGVNLNFSGDCTAKCSVCGKKYRKNETKKGTKVERL
jgi:UDP-2-acetamido-3-amino-2,3-dideoxy-glucuronate N-acetyltransferase